MIIIINKEDIMFFQIMKKQSCFILLMSIVMVLLSCNQNGKGDKILIVEIQGENSFSENEVSEEALIKEALQKGGSITLNVEVLRNIDSNFDSLYATVNSDGNFLVRPAILNFIGSQGWHLLQIFGLPGNPQYFFVKSR
jgi:hypothetical protein